MAEIAGRRAKHENQQMQAAPRLEMQEAVKAAFQAMQASMFATPLLDSKAFANTARVLDLTAQRMAVNAAQSVRANWLPRLRHWARVLVLQLPGVQGKHIDMTTRAIVHAFFAADRQVELPMGVPTEYRPWLQSRLEALVARLPARLRALHGADVFQHLHRSNNPGWHDFVVCMHAMLADITAYNTTLDGSVPELLASEEPWQHAIADLKQQLREQELREAWLRSKLERGRQDETEARVAQPMTSNKLHRRRASSGQLARQAARGLPRARKQHQERAAEDGAHAPTGTRRARPARHGRERRQRRNVAASFGDANAEPAPSWIEQVSGEPCTWPNQLDIVRQEMRTLRRRLAAKRGKTWGLLPCGRMTPMYVHFDTACIPVSCLC
jgi:hypothetical protein